MTKKRSIRQVLLGVMYCCAIVRCDSLSATPPAKRSDDSLSSATPAATASSAGLAATAQLLAPVRLEADGKPINIGDFSSIAHAGPWIADVDNDGDRDLLVGDFPGFFWLFDNVGSETGPKYTSKGKLQAGGVDAKTPVY
jgi:hypothetical protein